MEMLKIVLIIEGRKKERKKGREGRKKGRRERRREEVQKIFIAS